MYLKKIFTDKTKSDSEFSFELKNLLLIGYDSIKRNMQYKNITSQLQTFWGTKKFLKIFENFKKNRRFFLREARNFFSKLLLFCDFT